MAIESLSQFFDDIRAALMLKVPLRLKRESSRLNLAEFEDYRRQIQAEVKSGKTDGSLDSCGSVPQSLLAAIEIFRKTGSVSALLDGLFARDVARHRIVANTRWPTVYLCLLMFFAALGLILFSQRAVPIIQDLHQDLFFNSYENVVDDDFVFSARLVQVSAVCVLLASVWLFAGGARKFVMWLGGREYIAVVVTNSAVVIMQRLITSGVSSAQAQELAKQLLDVDSYESEFIEMSANRLLADSDLAIEQSLLSQQAQNCLSNLSLSTPTVLIAAFGGVLTLMYSIVLFSPMIVLLTETLKSGVTG